MVTSVKPITLTGGSAGAGSGYTWHSATSTTAKGQFKVDGKDADIIINGKSLSEWMAKVEERLLILQPKPELLEKYEALRNAYEQYKTLEALCVDNNNIINK